MTLQEKLRSGFGGIVPPICDHAASHIDNLETENAKCKAEVSALNRGMLNRTSALRIELAQRQEDIRELREERDLLKVAIEAMRTAGGSEEFQIAFDRAKELASAI